MNKKGQSILSEYMMIFFVVIAAIVAMTTFLQRGFQGRINDVRNFAVNSIVNDAVCDANCLMATGSKIAPEYEPYYAQSFSDVQQNSLEKTSLMPGNAQITGSIYTKAINQKTQANTFSTQLPAQWSNST